MDSLEKASISLDLFFNQRLQVYNKLKNELDRQTKK